MNKLDQALKTIADRATLLTIIDALRDQRDAFIQTAAYYDRVKDETIRERMDAKLLAIIEGDQGHG